MTNQDMYVKFKDLIMKIGQQWKLRGANSGYIRDFHYRDQPPGSFFPDAFFGYQTLHNHETGVVNYDTHWHVYVKTTGHFTMKLKCNKYHGEEVPFDNSDGNLVNKIDTGLTGCWKNSRSNSNSRDRGDSFHRMVKPRLTLGGRRNSKRIKKINKKQSSNRRNKNKRKQKQKN